MKKAQKSKKLFTQEKEQGVIRIRKNGNPTRLIADFSPKAIEIFGTREIILIEREGCLFIRKPTLDSKKVSIISKNNHFGFTSENYENLIGEYLIPNQDLDEYQLARQ